MQTGTAQDIVQRPADDYVAEFVRHVKLTHGSQGRPQRILIAHRLLPVATWRRGGRAICLSHLFKPVGARMLVPRPGRRHDAAARRPSKPHLQE